MRAALAKEPEIKYLDLLDEDETPQMSDAVLVMSQHKGGLEAFKSRHYGYLPSRGEHDWLLAKLR